MLLKFFTDTTHHTKDRLYNLLIDFNTFQLRHIEQIVQSNAEVAIDEEMMWQFTRVGDVAGRGRVQYDGNFDKWLDSKTQSLIRIRNADNFCLPRALVVAKALVHKKDSAIGFYLFKYF